MYTAASAATSRYTSLESESSNACAAPWNADWIDGGRATACSACRIRSTAVDSDAPFARLNEIVTAGNCARWLITSGERVTLIFAMPLSGTCPLLLVWLGR